MSAKPEVIGCPSQCEADLGSAFSKIRLYRVRRAARGSYSLDTHPLDRRKHALGRMHH